MVVDRAPFEFANAEDLPLRGDAWRPADAEEGAAIVICHGFKGFKDWGSFPYIAETLAWATRRPVITFNFSGNGIGSDRFQFTELDLFEANTFTKELADLRLILDRASSGGLPGVGEAAAFGLVGHSRGGGIAIIAGAEDERVSSLVTWAATSDFNRWSAETRAAWRERGRFEVLNVRTKQRMPLGVGLLEDTERNAERLDILGAASRLRIPFLVIHGAADEAIPASEAERLAATAPAASTRLEIVEGAGHTFGAGHPFRGTTDHLERVLQLSAGWFDRHLAAGEA